MVLWAHKQGCLVVRLHRQEASPHVRLLQAGYESFASLLLRRLKDAGAEGRIWDAQFGFKSRHGAADAIFLAKRRLE